MSVIKYLLVVGLLGAVGFVFSGLSAGGAIRSVSDSEAASIVGGCGKGKVSGCSNEQTCCGETAEAHLDTTGSGWLGEKFANCTVISGCSAGDCGTYISQWDSACDS